LATRKPRSTLIQVGRFNVHMRQVKGYVQRPVAEDELPALKPHPQLLNLVFQSLLE